MHSLTYSRTGDAQQHGDELRKKKIQLFVNFRFTKQRLCAIMKLPNKLNID